MKNRKLKRALPALMLASCMLLLFQNCGPAKVSGGDQLYNGQGGGGSNGPQTTPTPTVTPTATVTPTPPGATPTPTPVMTPTPTPTATPVVTPTPTPTPTPPPPTPTPTPTPTPSPTPMMEKTAAIKTMINYCLDVSEASLANAASIEQWECLGVNNQVFRLRSVANVTNGFNVIAMHSGQCMNTRARATADGTLVNQWPCDGASNQVWVYQNLGNDHFRLVDSNSGKCLTVRDFDINVNQQAFISTCNSGNLNQVFHW